MTPLSVQNSRVKQARRLSRRSERSERRLFLVDGPQGVEGALGRPGCVVEVFATPEAVARYADLLHAAPEVTLVDERALASLTDAVTPPGLVALCRSLDRPLVDVLDGTPQLVAACVEVRDPGNAGTIVRTADAAGADAVVMVGDAVDLHNAKTVRASAGSAFHLPVALERDAEAALATLRGAGLQVLAAAGDGEVDLEDPGPGLLERPTAWLFGNEAHGLPSALAASADHRVRIPIHGRAESLNLAIAAALCLYASARAQRAR